MDSPSESKSTSTIALDGRACTFLSTQQGHGDNIQCSLLLPRLWPKHIQTMTDGCIQPFLSINHVVNPCRFHPWRANSSIMDQHCLLNNRHYLHEDCTHPRFVYCACPTTSVARDFASPPPVPTRWDAPAGPAICSPRLPRPRAYLRGSRRVPHLAAAITAAAITAAITAAAITAAITAAAITAAITAAAITAKGTLGRRR